MWMRLAWVWVLAAAVSCAEGYAEYECPPNAACRAPCKRGTPEICSEDPCPKEEQLRVDLCEDGYRSGSCQCRDTGDGCSGLECVAGTFCFQGKCLKRFPCGDEVCEPGWSCMFPGNCVQVLTSDATSPGSLQVVGDRLFFTDQSMSADAGEAGAHVRAVGIDDSEVMNLVDSEEPVRKLAADGDNVYYVRGDDEAQQLMRVAQSGGEPVMLHEGLRVVDLLTVDSGRVYWLDQRDDAVALMSVAVSGDEPAKELWVRDDVSTGPLVAGEKIYWVERNAKFWRSSLDGSDAEELASSERAGERLRVMATDGEAFYFGWSDANTSGVARYDADAKQIDRIGTDSHNEEGVPVALAVDDKTVYVQLRYDVKPPRTGLFRMKKSAKSSSELTFIWSTDTDPQVTTQPWDAESIYITSSNFRLLSEHPQVVRVRKRW